MKLSPVWSRPLAPLTLALAAGIGAPSLGLAFPPVWIGLGVVLLLLLLAVLAWRGWPLPWVGCLLFFCLGQGLYHTALQPPLPELHVRFLPQQTPVSLIGVVQSLPVLTGADYRLELSASAWSAGGDWRPATGVVWLSGGAEAAGLRPGDRIAVRLRLRPVADFKNPGGSGRQLALARRQIFVTGRIWQHLPPIQLPPETSWPGLAPWREQVRSSVRAFLASQPQPARSIFLALLLGDQREISPALRQVLQRTGTSHLVAISGLHLAMIAGFAFALIFWLLRRSSWLLLRLNALKTAVFLAVFPTLAYAWLAGGSPATQRAALMLLAGVLLVLLDRHRDPYAALVLAAFVILVASPLQLYAPSLQLSFLAAWGLLYLAPPLLRPAPEWLASRTGLPVWVKHPVRWAASGLAVALAATLATLPVVIAWFHQTPTYGILINLVAVPLVGGLVLPSSLLAVGLSWLPGLLAPGLLALSRYILDAALVLMSEAAALPGVVVRLPTPTALQTAAYFVLLISLLRAPRRLWRWSGVGLGLLVLTGTIAWSHLQNFQATELRLTALDTPGDLAVVATLPRGRTLVVSAGRPRFLEAQAPNSALIAYLHTQRVQRLDYLAALTITRENAPTLLALAREFEIGQFWYGGDRHPISSFWEFRNLLGDQGREVRNLSLTPLAEEIGAVQVRSRQLPRRSGTGTGGPILLQFTCLGRHLLIIPPGPRAWQDQCLAAGLPPAEVVILPATHLREDFMALLADQVALREVIVTGIPPAAAVISPQNSVGVWRFTHEGAVTLRMSPEELEVRQWLPPNYQ